MKVKECSEFKIDKKIRDPRPEIDPVSRAFFHFGKAFAVLFPATFRTFARTSFIWEFGHVDKANVREV